MQVEYPLIKIKDNHLIQCYSDLWEICELEWQDKNKFGIFTHSEDKTINQLNTIMSTFFLVYNNKKYNVHKHLDFFYERQEEDGAIRSDYSIDTGKYVSTPRNPHGIGVPLFSWVEYNLYHKLDNKKRVQRVVEILERYWNWMEGIALQENGLYAGPLGSGLMSNSPRGNVKYPLDFNLQQAINAYYMAELGSLINDKVFCFRYRKKYFGLRIQINNLMWDQEQQFYFDLDEKGERLKSKTVAAFWSFLAKIPNESKFIPLIEHLESPQEFGGGMPVPTLSRSQRGFSEHGEGYRGSVFPLDTFIIVKGLEMYSAFRRAHILATKHIEAITRVAQKYDKQSTPYDRLFEAYKPDGSGPARWRGKRPFPRRGYITSLGLTGIALVIENIIGLRYNLPKKTVTIILPTLDAIGIENVHLKKNIISIICEKAQRGWEIHLDCEKLYYLTINILDQKKKKTLPIPSGRCSILIGKI